MGKGEFTEVTARFGGQMDGDRLTLEERAYNFETMRHIERVRNLLNACAVELLRRGELHDQTKLEQPEVGGFAQAPDLADMKFESDAYRASREALKTALDHHYARNRHHPEHFEDGVDEMDLFDILEMLMDWRASSERQHAGNIRKSLQDAVKRFGIGEQLAMVLANTVNNMGW